MRDWNITTNEVYWSPRWKALLGYDEQEISTHPDEWLGRLHHGDAQRVKDTLSAYLASGCGHFDSEHRLLHKNGTFRWMRCRGAAVTDRSGRAARFAGSLTDITDAKMADALTGLPNRLLFVDVLERTIKRITERRSDYVLAILVLGLNPWARGQSRASRRSYAGPSLRGPVSPVEFIPMAEDTGLIRQLGRLVLAESCRQMATWQQQFGHRAPRYVCVNVAAGQFGHDFASEVERILNETGLEPSKLKLEITESAFIKDGGSAEETLARLRSIGVEWSIDDFGTGYSSLSYLHRLKAHTVKIDRSFISRIGDDPKGSEMVRAIIALALNLGMDVVAEGVETIEQVLELQTLGCDRAQGFYFSRAVDLLAADHLIASQPFREAAATVP
jgi:PAS domain S-box-containing protein